MIKQLFSCNRWFTYVFGLMLSLISGVAYMFGAISPKLKDTMGYEQYQINMIGTLANVGGNLGIVPSIFFSYAGPRATCLLAASMVFGGYFLIYCGVMHWFHTNYIVIGLFFAVMQNGTSAAYTTALSTNIPNFTQGSRGVVIGSMAACLALSSAIFTFFYSIVFKKNLSPYLFFCSIVGGTIPLISTLFMNVVQKKDDDMWPSIEEQEETNPLSLNKDSTDVVPVYGSTSTKQIVEVELILDSEEDDLATEEVFKEVNPFRMLISLDFWLLFVVFFAGVGSAYVINNNLGSIVISFGAKDGTQNPMVLIFAGGNFSGRIITGILSDRLSKYINRITILNVAVLGIGLVHYGFVFATVNMMYPLILLLGLVYGSLYSMIPSFISDRFGQKYFAINFNVACIAPTAGSYLLATLLASSIYKHHSKEGSKKCFGRQCYQLTFVVCTGVCVLAYVVGLVLMYRSRKMYDAIRAYNKAKGNSKPSEAAH